MGADRPARVDKGYGGQRAGAMHSGLYGYCTRCNDHTFHSPSNHAILIT